MSIVRLSKEGLQKILSGQVREPATCVVKFYSNSCPLCHNLKEYYQDIANQEKYSDLHFFAFNIDDYPVVESKMKFNGVPTISLIKTGQPKPKVRILNDPDEPNEKTWYKVRDIKEFIEKEK
jgi:thioredoxin-like negative regulator of GroEL